MKFEAFPDWDSVLAHVSAGNPVYYHAPLDISPVLVGARVSAKSIRVRPSSRDADPFTADHAHLDRFRRPSSAL
jgi:hypothetical protein